MYSDELRHHGIPFQKWGRRLYQNKDGSLTPLGRLRYGVGPARKWSGGQSNSSTTTKKKSSANAESASKKQASGESVSETAETVVAKARTSSIRKSTRNMTDEELKKNIERLRLEIEYKQKADELAKLKAKNTTKSDSKPEASNGSNNQQTQGNKQSNTQQNNQSNNQQNKQSSKPSKDSSAVVDNHKNDPVPAKSDNKNSAAKDFVKKVLREAGEDVAKQAAKYAMGTVINTIVGDKVVSVGKVIPRASETNEAPKVKSESKPASSDEKKKKK